MSSFAFVPCSVSLLPWIFHRVHLARLLPKIIHRGVSDRFFSTRQDPPLNVCLALLGPISIPALFTTPTPFWGRFPVSTARSGWFSSVSCFAGVKSVFFRLSPVVGFPF